MASVRRSIVRVRVRRARTMAPMIVVAGEALIDLLVDADGRSARSRAAGRSTPRGRSPGSVATVAYLGCLSTDRFGGDAPRRARSPTAWTCRWPGRRTRRPPWPSRSWIAMARPRTASTPRRPPRRRSARPPSRPPSPRGPRAFHLGTLGLVLEPMASALAVARADRIPGHARDARPELPARASSRTGQPTSAGSIAVIARADVVKVSADDLAFLDPGRRPSTPPGRSSAAGQPSCC